MIAEVKVHPAKPPAKVAIKPLPMLVRTAQNIKAASRLRTQTKDFTPVPLPLPPLRVIKRGKKKPPPETEQTTSKIERYITLCFLFPVPFFFASTRDRTSNLEDRAVSEIVVNVHRGKIQNSLLLRS
jgi:hypothetical protein